MGIGNRAWVRRQGRVGTISLPLMGIGNTYGDNYYAVDLSLITPHGDRKLAYSTTPLPLRHELITPHGDRKRDVVLTGPMVGLPRSLPLMGIGNARCRGWYSGVYRCLITPHGDRKPARRR